MILNGTVRFFYYFYASFTTHTGIINYFAMGHHDHHHIHSIDHLNRAFLIGILLNLIFVIVELTAGLFLDSIALISDAGHNLSDVISLVVSLFAFRLARLKPTPHYTYGYKKSTVLASLFNACILLVAVGAILMESFDKLRNPQPIEGNSIAWVAGVGILVNAFTAWLFLKDRKHDLNVKGAFLHMAADTLVSVGVVISGIIISYTGWYIIDPVIGIVISVVILISSIRLLHDSLRLSLDGVPEGIDIEQLRQRLLASDPRIQGIHHLHVWAISTTENSLTAHIVTEDIQHAAEIKHALHEQLKQEGILHATLEFERPEETCDAPECDCGREH